MVNYIKMPPPLYVLGLFYTILGVTLIISYLKNGYWDGVLGKLKSILRQNMFCLCSVLLLIVMLIIFVDKPVTQWCTSHYNPDIYTLIDFISSMSEGWFIGGVLITAILFLDLFRQANLAIIMRISLMASLFAGMVNSVIKFIFNRQRPSIGMEPYSFFHFFASHDHNLIDLTYAYNSMSSGHTITTFAAITPLILYLQSKLAKVLCLVFGLTVVVSRIYTINHWLSDVLVAVALGVLLGYTVYSQNSFRIKSK